ncbi:hypothetical protein KIL84_001094 [Mauremys mutica]|uniref:Uncharacterized protein n=1 Tax=Mauremys mutica TaxID=74926 RepID=A0A9D3WTV8_9SAUR|nr:hypothetical protein KIL84_001094 [Mauremys mutica]
MHQLSTQQPADAGLTGTQEAQPQSEALPCRPLGRVPGQLMACWPYLSQQQEQDVLQTTGLQPILDCEPLLPTPATLASFPGILTWHDPWHLIHGSELQFCLLPLTSRYPDPADYCLLLCDCRLCL